jgi:hypothetical protein
MRQRKFPRADRPGGEVSVRRQRGRPDLAGWPALGLGCALVVAACGGPPARPAGHAGGPAPLSRQLRQAIEAAQDPAGTLVKTTETQRESGTSGSVTIMTIWTDLANGNTMLQRGSGPVAILNWEREYYQGRVPHWQQTQVNYATRTWWSADDHASAPVSGAAARAAGGGYAPAALVDDVLGQASAEVVGSPVFDGARAIELSAAEAGSRFDFWVDGRTYRMLRSVKHFPAATHIPPVTFDYQWTRASAALVDRINHPQVPAGFTRIPAGPGAPRR